MAVRLGVLKFRGYKLKKTPVAGFSSLTDADFRPDFEQKGVDMRIGLYIASYSALKCIDRTGLVTEDTDCVPAMKFARKSGVQVVLVALPGGAVPTELAQHSDYDSQGCLAVMALAVRSRSNWTKLGICFTHVSPIS